MSTARRLGVREAHAARPDLVRQLVQLATAAPLRPPVEQAPEDGLGLFDQVRSPSLF